MKIGFFAVNEPHISMARSLIASVHKAMPGVELWHLADGDCQTLPEVTGTHRCHGDMPMAIRRMSLQASLEGEWLFVDTDILIRKDVRHIFDTRFDVALTDRIGTQMQGTPYGSIMPYNLGVAFSTSRLFWAGVRSLLYTLPQKFQKWEGDQRVICDMMTVNHRFGFDIKVLPGRIYNYPPVTENDPKIAEASIVHYKGARKEWIAKAA